MKGRALFLLILISSLYFSQNKKTIKNFVDSFVEYRIQSGKFIKKESDVLVLGIMKSNECENCWTLSSSFDSKYLLMNFPYKIVVEVKGFKTIIYDNEFAEKFNNIFKTLPYENFNLAQVPFNYTTKSWNFVFNHKDEIELIYGFQGDKTLLDFLKKRGFKFSKDFNGNMDLN